MGRLRDQLKQRDRIYQMISVHNPLAAKIANTYKFDWLSVGGYNISGSAYGMPDVGLLTFERGRGGGQTHHGGGRSAGYRRRR